MTEGQAPNVESTSGQAPPAPSAAPAAPESVLDTDLPQGTDSFPRDYVEKLRQEAASHRVKAKELEPWEQFHQEYRDHFASPDDLRQFLGQFNDAEGATQFAFAVLQEAGFPVEQILQMVQGQQAQGQQGQSEQEERPLTVQEFQAWQQEMQQRQQMAQEDQAVEKSLRDLKVPKEARQYVLAAAISEPAHLGYAERIKRGYDGYKKALDAHAASLSQAEQANRAKSPGSIGGAPSVPGEDKPASDWAEARRRAAARMGAAGANPLNQ